MDLQIPPSKPGYSFKINSKERDVVVSLPKPYAESSEPHCRMIRDGKDVPAQVLAVKNIFTTLHNYPDALQFLADLYFYCPLKHPVRNQISKLLKNADVTLLEAVIGSLSKSIRNLVAVTRGDSNIVQWNTTVTSFRSCFENFSVGLKAFEQCLDPIFPFLLESVRKYRDALAILHGKSIGKHDVVAACSPSERNDYHLYTHNAIRVLLSSVQEFGQQIKELFRSELMDVETICMVIAMHNETPMDPRINCAIIVTHTTRLFGNYEAFINWILTDDKVCFVAFAAGVISTCTRAEFIGMSSLIIQVCCKTEKIAEANATVPNTLLCATRTLYQFSKFLCVTDIPEQCVNVDVKRGLSVLLSFIYSNLEHHMDSVRYLCKDILRNYVCAVRKFGLQYLLTELFDSCNGEWLSLNVKCVMLKQMVSVLGADTVIKGCPMLFDKVFPEYLARDFVVDNLFEALMLSNRKQVELDAWIQMWIQYLLQIAVANDDRLPQIEVLIGKAVKFEPKVVQHIIENIEGNIPLSTKLSVLWTVRKTGAQIVNFHEIMQKFSSCLRQSILSESDEKRIIALRLLVETHKTTEPLTSLECDLLVAYLKFNSNCQSPATRQKSVCLLHKALKRCEINLKKACKISNAITNQDADEQPFQLRFLKEVVHILVLNLSLDSNFSRRILSLDLLKFCLQICIDCNLKLDEMLPTNAVLTIFNVLNDSYETNKVVARDILKLIEDHSAGKLVEIYRLNLTTKSIEELLVSVRPTDSVTGTYQLDFFCNSVECGVFGVEDLPQVQSTYYAALRWLLLGLTAGYDLARTSILQAAKMNPLYGGLFAVHHLLKHLDFAQIARDILWRVLLRDIIVLCMQLTDVVAPVVNSSSPEGHLPNDFGSFPEGYEVELNVQHKSENKTDQILSCQFLSKRVGKINLNAVKTTPQMVLLCAWRTVKEVSLLLGEIALRAPIENIDSHDQFLVTQQQILEIGEHFKKLLSETKHRGAFEQAYVGFSKLCSRLWRVTALELNLLPMRWLEELLSLIADDEKANEKLCATRRSAGVPFMVQALITSELQVDTAKSLQYTMQHLFDLCSSQQHSIEARTHAMNIMRALFRCTELNEAVTEYAAEAVICAVRAYDSHTWPERNSATLLFAALVTRIFGVQRSRDSDNLSVRNKMTGRVFFMRYPKLYDFFLEELKSASTSLHQNRKVNKLQPVLLILSRLYPSALDGTDSNYQLTEFMPFVGECTAVPDMSTRHLAAKAISVLVPYYVVSDFIRKTCIAVALHNSAEHTLNVLHGRLLQLLLLLKQTKTITEDDMHSIAFCLASFHRTTGFKNAVVVRAVLEILIEIMQRLDHLQQQHEFRDIPKILEYFSTNLNAMKAECIYYPIVWKVIVIYQLHTLRLTHPISAIAKYLMELLTITAHSVEAVETSMNVILVLFTRLKCNDDFLSEYEIGAGERQFVCNLSTAAREQLEKELRQEVALESILLQMIKKQYYYPDGTMKAYAILSFLNNSHLDLKYLITTSQKSPDNIKSALSMCVESLVRKRGADINTAEVCLEYLSEIAQTCYHHYLRNQAAKILAHLTVHFPKALKEQQLKFVHLYVRLILTLLMDDDCDIRNYTAQFVQYELRNKPEILGIELMGSEISVSTLVQRLFVQSTANILHNIEADDDYILKLLSGVVEELAQVYSTIFTRSSENEQRNHDSAIFTEIEVFDRNETNIYAEPLRAIHDIVTIFKNTFTQRQALLIALDNILQTVSV